MNGKIWFDFDNSPHVPLFFPLIKELKKRGYDVYLTARDVAQTLGLLEKMGLDFKLMGKQFIKVVIAKVFLTLWRGIMLYFHLKKKNIICSISSSRSAFIAGRLLSIPTIAFFDYEHVSSFLANHCADIIFMPEIISDQIANKAGISLKKLNRYPGIKEQIYIDDIIKYRAHEFDIGEDKIIVTIRIPAKAHYASKKSDELFRNILEFLIQNPSVFLVSLFRRRHDIKFFQNICNRSKAEIYIPEKVLPGIELILGSDLVLSGGGTMIREAAILGVPAYTFFRGQEGAIDLWLEKQNRLTFIRDIKDINKIKLEKKKSAIPLTCGCNQVAWICDEIIQLIKKYSNYS